MVQSLQRALDIVEQVARSDQGARLTDISNALGLKKTTAHNLIGSLHARGYLVRDGQYRYQLGPALDDLARLRMARGVFRRAEPAMRELYAAYGQATVTFSELAGDEITCRLRMAPDLPGVLRRPRSQTFSPFSSATGVCLLAVNGHYRESTLAADAFEESGQRTWPTRQAFDQALAQTVRKGVAVLPAASGWRLAAPVGEQHALGLCLAMTQDDEAAVCAGLKDAAAVIADTET